MVVLLMWSQGKGSRTNYAQSVDESEHSWVRDWDACATSETAACFDWLKVRRMVMKRAIPRINPLACVRVTIWSRRFLWSHKKRN